MFEVGHVMLKHICLLCDGEQVGCQVDEFFILLVVVEGSNGYTILHLEVVGVGSVVDYQHVLE